MQKRRELKAAGVDVNKRRKRKNQIDYATEVPFEHKAPLGFYEVGLSRARARALCLSHSLSCLSLSPLALSRTLVPFEHNAPLGFYVVCTRSCHSRI